MKMELAQRLLPCERARWARERAGGVGSAKTALRGYATACGQAGAITPRVKPTMVSDTLTPSLGCNARKASFDRAPRGPRTSWSAYGPAQPGCTGKEGGRRFRTAMGWMDLLSKLCRGGGGG